MTTLHATVVRDKALLPRAEFERLIELAERSEKITLLLEEDDLPIVGIMRLAEQGGRSIGWQKKRTSIPPMI